MPSCRPVADAELLELVDGHDPATCLAAWHEPLATTMDLSDLIFRLCEAAAGAGVDMVDHAELQRVERGEAGYRLTTTAGEAFANVVVDLDPQLAVSRAAGLGGTVVAPTHQLLTTGAMAPLLARSLTIDDVTVSQRRTGEVDLVIPMPGSLARFGLESAIAGVRRVVAALPAVAGGEVVGRIGHREATSFDGLPVVGPVAKGLWACGALGRHHFDLLPLIAEELAAAVLSDHPGGVLDAFSPRRAWPESAVIPSASRLSCPTCGVRDRAEFDFVAPRLVHRAGCGRVLGAVPGVVRVIDEHVEPAPAPASATQRPAATRVVPATGSTPDRRGVASPPVHGGRVPAAAEQRPVAGGLPAAHQPRGSGVTDVRDATPGPGVRANRQRPPTPGGVVVARPPTPAAIRFDRPAAPGRVRPPRQRPATEAAEAAQGSGADPAAAPGAPGASAVVPEHAAKTGPGADRFGPRGTRV